MGEDPVQTIQQIGETDKGGYNWHKTAVQGCTGGSNIDGKVTY